MYFVNGAEDLPFMNLEDWKDLLVYTYKKADGNGDKEYTLTYEVSEDGKTVTLTRETGYNMIVDFEAGTFTFLETLNKWMDTALTICSMFASYYVLTGIANLAEKMADAATKAVALKSRTLVEGSFCATALFKLIISIFKIQNGSTISTILAIIALLLELVSYILYLRALSKDKKMLAN